ncbi:(E2-independent) E3 ubiquitin-conjugating enzyme FATS [Tachysurus fulvidraco]|uniref:(E2-independent) E3 ubiquitin-conjugating enzyme FATS n=1 Tax=Tachysurus fulvidraco TaxID=1234273 RepID=UPI001FEEDAFF|nr:(E2-independent) E3 ubiquitin-conjugating enzyme FATS [Tachysurus fulvidraco]XP_047672948.1 (E2-independent) E3 ubiquitin-conjugating enzyme FATS [Tachysurus fulvidraco]
MDIKSESWRQQPILQRRVGQEAKSNIVKSSGEECSRDRPPRAARPHSCIEGRLKDEWLQTFNSLQSNELPPYLQKSNTPWSESPSLVSSSQSSLESMCSGLESKEKVQIKTGPSTQRAKVCCLASVRFGWLPLQRHVVRKESPKNNAVQQDGITCKVKLKPPITPVLSCSSVTAKGSELGEDTVGLGVRGMSGAISLQTDGKRKATLAERDQDTALDRATSVQNSSRDRFLWQTPVHRRGSVPQVSLHTAPTIGGRMSSKHSSSISSITIISKKVIRSSSLPDNSISDQDRKREPSPMALNDHINDSDHTYPTKSIPQRKAVVVKMTEQRVETRRFLQPGAKNGPVYNLNSTRPNGEHYMSPLYTRSNCNLTSSNLFDTKNQPLAASLSVTSKDNHILKSKMTHTERHSQVPFCLVTHEPQMPVVLRRKATIIKVQEERDTFSRDYVNNRSKATYRHSFSGLNVSDMKPQLNNEYMLSGSEMRDLSSNNKLYKSTVSLQLTSTSGARLDDSHTSRASQPRRPASCYASLFSPVEPRADGSQDVSDHSTIHPHETNTDLACSAASSLNRCWSTKEGAGSHDKIYTRTESSASDKGQSKRESALLRNQPLTLIKMPDASTHETHDAIVALNAAAIIANIKLQSEQKKKTLISGNTDGQKHSASLSKSAETFGSGSK